MNIIRYYVVENNVPPEDITHDCLEELKQGYADIKHMWANDIEGALEFKSHLEKRNPLLKTYVIHKVTVSAASELVK